VTNVLGTWNDGPARRAVIEFVEQTVSGGVPAGERVAVFDNDGTLWCEKPMPIQADFILRRLYEMAQADPGLRGRQPWKAAYERDYGWLGTVLAEHYAGNDANVRTLLAAGNSNGDIPMLDFTQHPGKPSLRLLVLHDDGQREFAYTSGAEQALERAGKNGWTIVSIKNDWATVF
jgi:hypothetical protein